MINAVVIVLMTLGQQQSPSGDRRIAELPYVVRGPYRSVQVNVGASGVDVRGDAANSPSMAIDPTDPSKIVIGWQQFGKIKSNFRQAGCAFSHDGGKTWRGSRVLAPGQFRMNPLLKADSGGGFYYFSRSGTDSVELFRSVDGGRAFEPPKPVGGGGNFLAVIDEFIARNRRTVFCAWGGRFTLSTDDGQSFSEPAKLPSSFSVQALALDAKGRVFAAALQRDTVGLIRSSSVRDIPGRPMFARYPLIDVGGEIKRDAGPNPGGSLGQLQLAIDRSAGRIRGHMYLLCSIDPPGSDPLDVMFLRSADAGKTWTTPARVNDDAESTNAWQWFGTMSVAPNGRIDVVWNDTRRSGRENLSEVFYTFSTDAGDTWSASVPVTPEFDTFIGWPQKNNIGDRHTLISADDAAYLAYAATFNGGQDVYFLRIPHTH